ncbi:gamma-glutamylcyclotransferase family protein [Marinibaculum pumilum]|uniref:Gamma-glutamylcyclotransferase family protein n=1 Tax=Marinibaculum pumilum TaxID=1766165 RepID=A0ABV7KZ98_9PROT
MHPRLLSLAAGIALSLASLPAAADDCHPDPDPQMPQYTLGYGSLMETASKARTVKQSGPSLPVRVAGFRRGWIDPGTDPGPQPVYLGVRPDPDASMIAAIYRLDDAADIHRTDRREYIYCRSLVPPADLKMLGGQPRPNGQVWLYVTPESHVGAATPETPIVQSYVDVFVSGCLELQDRYDLDGFARECIDSTTGWSAHWVNDRIYPRRPFVYRKNAVRIDRLLQAALPEIFPRIRIE